MTREEAATLIRMNFVLYKLGAKPLSDSEMETTIDVWAYQFRDYDGESVKRAFLAANRVCVYPVTVADIFKQLSQGIDPETEWKMLAGAAHGAQKFLNWRTNPGIVGVDGAGNPIHSNGHAELQALFDGLPPAAKEYIGNVNGLIELANIPDLTYRRNEFLKQTRDAITTSPREAAQLRAANQIALKVSTVDT